MLTNYPATIDAPEEYLTALHEAGHVIAHLAVGNPFLRATIVGTEEYAGYVENDPKAPKLDYRLLSVIFLAGTIAVDIGFGSRWVHRDSMLYCDWGLARFFMRPRSKKQSGELTANQQVSIERLVERIGANKIAQTMSMIFSITEPEAAAAVEVEISKLARATERLIRRRWADVVKLAEALVERKTLSYFETLQILAKE